MIKVLLADDEATVRATVRTILTGDPGIEVVAEAADGREAVQLAISHRPDIALLDVRMPELDGLDAVAEIRRAVPETAAIILTTFGDDAYISRALSEGAGGFLIKSGDPRELLAGVRAVADGAAYLSPRVARRVIAELDGDQLTRKSAARERIDALSERERQVLALLGAGSSNAEIARSLNLVEGTVKTHVSSILTRLGVRNRVEAAIIAYEAKLIDGPG